VATGSSRQGCSRKIDLQNLEDVPGTWVFLADFEFWTSQVVGFQKDSQFIDNRIFLIKESDLYNLARRY
jgi:hypothetical protein